MSFDIEKFSIVGGNSKSQSSFQICSYKSDDSITNVLQVGYFNEVRNKLAVNNIIHFLSLNDNKLYFLRVYQIHLNDGVKTEIAASGGSEDGGSGGESGSGIFAEISVYGKRYAKTKELIDKCDAGSFVVSCEYTKLGITGIANPYNPFNIGMKSRYDSYYQAINTSSSNTELDNLNIDFSDLVNAEISRINNL